MDEKERYLNSEVDRILELASEEMDKCNYLSVIAYQKVALELLLKKEHILSSENYDVLMRVISKAAIHKSEKSVEPVFESIESQAKSIISEYAALKIAESVDVVKKSANNIQNSAELLLAYNEKGFAVPRNDYRQLVVNSRKIANERYLEIVKNAREVYKREISLSTSKDFIFDATNKLLSLVEDCRALLFDEENFNFHNISLKQINERVQDDYSKRIEQLEK